MEAKNIIFCVGNTPDKDNAFLDFARHAGIPVKRLLGSYKGVEETSFMVPASHAYEILPLVKGEESILLLDGDFPKGTEEGPYAELYFPNDHDWEPLGHFSEVSPEVAKTLDAWTLDPETGRYFTAH